MTTKLKWRLGKLPTPEEVTLLLSQGVLTKDEAREILFSLETDEDRDKVSLQEEIKFLRALVDKMSSRSQILTYIPQVATPNYTQKPWWQGYQVYCDASNSISTTGYSGSITNAIGSASGSNSITLTNGTANSAILGSMTNEGLNAIYSYTPEPSFTEISTF